MFQLPRKDASEMTLRMGTLEQSQCTRNGFLLEETCADAPQECRLWLLTGTQSAGAGEINSNVKPHCWGFTTLLCRADPWFGLQICSYALYFLPLQPRTRVILHLHSIRNKQKPTHFADFKCLPCLYVPTSPLTVPAWHTVVYRTQPAYVLSHTGESVNILIHILVKTIL